MKLQLKYQGENLWGQPIYQDPQGRHYRNVDMLDNNNLNSIKRTQSPFCSVVDLRDIRTVEITHRDGSVDTIKIPNNQPALP